MTERSARASKEPSTALVKKHNVPVQMTDLSIFDDTYAFMKERFSEEMKRMDEHMLKLGKALTHFYNQSVTVESGMTSPSDQSIPGWDVITSSPLVQGEGDNIVLKLQFDVSQFDPTEVNVKLSNDMLTVSALHNENTDNNITMRQYNRQFLLPHGTDYEAVVSSLSRDGVLTVQAPLKPPPVLK
ncbi:protein lethal(2)essential for life-like [Anticarsia gemmatalis]|uniref:protein lethal(2)essential for life-like n=1 Tax=Anticarsia gemmatalis TaxID=129554 RepID=UPI003F7731E2